MNLLHKKLSVYFQASSKAPCSWMLIVLSLRWPERCFCHTSHPDDNEFAACSLKTYPTNNSISSATKERLAKTTQEVDSQIQHMHRADRKRVHSIDKHLFHMSAEQRITQSLHRKQQWIQCVTRANEAWVALCDSQIKSQWQVAPLWNQASGQRPQVRLRQENWASVPWAQVQF